MKIFKPLLLAMAFAASMPFAISAHAQAMDHSKMGGMSTPGAPASMSEGEVRKVDKEAKKITLKHGDIKNLDMPGMTMVFQVKDAALAQITAGRTTLMVAHRLSTIRHADQICVLEAEDDQQPEPQPVHG